MAAGHQRADAGLMPTRTLGIWNATHDNGWMTTAAENPDGTYSAWATPGETVSVDYLEDGPEHARIAAEFALKRKTGHEQCSERCSGWTYHEHAHKERDSQET